MENSPIEQFPELLVKMMAIELGCDIDIYIAKRKKSERLASSKKPGTQIKSEERVEERVVAEAAVLQRAIGSQLLSRTFLPSAIAEELSRTRDDRSLAAIPFDSNPPTYPYSSSFKL